MGIKVRELITKLSIDGDKAVDGLAKFGLAVDGVKAGLDILTKTFDIAKRVMFDFVNEQTAVGDNIAKTARSMGLTAQELQRVIFAAERSGVPMTNLIKSSQNLARNMRDAALAGGKGGFATALTEVGLSMDVLIGLSFEEKLGKIGEALQALPTQAARVAASQKLLGEEAGPKFASFLAEGTAGIKALGDEAERLGFVLGDDALGEAEAFQDAVANLSAVVKGLKRSIGIELAPVVKKMIVQFKDWLLVNRRFIKQKAEKVIFLIGEAIQFVLDRGEEWIETFLEIVDTVGDLVAIVATAVDALGGLENTIKLAAAAWVTYQVAQAAALGPIGIAITAVTALAIAFADVDTNAEKAEKGVARFGKALPGSRRATSKEREALGLRVAKAARSEFGIGSRLVRELAQLDEGSLGAINTIASDNATSVLENFVRNRSFFEKVRGRLNKVGSLVQKEKERLKIKRSADAQREKANRAEETASKAAAARAEAERRHAALLKSIGNVSKTKNETLSDEELFKLINIAGTTGQSLTGMIGTRKIEGGTPPVVAVRISKNEITQHVNAPVTVNGASGQIVEELAEIVDDSVARTLGEQMSEALDELQPVLAR